MINRVFVEKHIAVHPRTLKILKHLGKDPVLVEDYSDYWGRTKKPYLQKRDNLNLFIAEKRGITIKEAPDAYGTTTGKHYYYIHAYNCIYECQYCYLQGHFNTPDLVFFINHEDIIAEMQEIVDANPDEDIWFHSGEFSDSLALSHITGELATYWEFFAKNPRAKLEIRTKSVNIREVVKLPPLVNAYISFSLSAQKTAKDIDTKCPSVKARIHAMTKLVNKGFKLGIHLDPIVYEDDFKTHYQQLIQDIFAQIDAKSIAYLSIGVVRFTKDVYKEVKQNYPQGQIFAQDFVKSFDEKIRYNRPMRKWILGTVKELLLPYLEAEKIYLCMED